MMMMMTLKSAAPPMRIQPSQLTALQISETKYRVDVLTNHEHIASTLSFFDTME